MSKFDEFYAHAVGERWASLKSELLKPAAQVARYTRFALESGVEPKGDPTPVANCYQSSERAEPDVAANGLLPFYRMDLASVLPALALDVQDGDRVLDMCAAPGGKSLILAESLGESGELVANDLSDARLARLKRVLRQYLPSSVMEQVRVTHHDASRWALFEKEAYDRILLDAPCSGERHLLENPEELKKWSPARTRHLSTRQYALLCAAVDSVRPGGRVVYSTCSISPHENDAIIAKLMKKRAAQVEPVRISSHVGEHTEFGQQIWPDTSGWGPIYFTCLQKKG